MKLRKYIRSGFVFAEKFGASESLPELERRGFTATSRPRVGSDGITFDGIDDKFVTVLGGGYYLSGISIICRFKIISNLGAGYQSLVGKYTSTNNQRMVRIVTYDNNLRTGYSTTGTGGLATSDLQALNLNQFYVVSVTYNNTDLVTYLDAINLDSRSVTLFSANAPIAIGDGDGYSQPSNSLISHILIAPRALTATEIADITTDLNNS